MAEKILVVDDDLDSLRLIGLMLQRQGYSIVAASNGMQALAKAVSEMPNLIILDVMMPDLDGYEVCRRLRANPTTAHIPIIMFTAKTQVDDKVAGFEAGADDYLTKPTHPAELTSRVKVILARSAGAQPARAQPQNAASLRFLGPKGGLGGSTLAVNVAATLTQNGQSVALVELRPGVGSLGLSLGFSRASGLSNLLQRPIAEITPQALEGEMVVHSSGLRMLLSSPRAAEAQAGLTVEQAELVIKQMGALVKIVLLDLGPGLTSLNTALVKMAEQITIPVEPQRVTLMMARSMLHSLREMGIPHTRVNVVFLNRVQSGLQIPWQEAEELLGHELVAIVSPAPELSFQAAEAGYPMILYQPDSITASQLRKLADGLSSKMNLAAG